MLNHTTHPRDFGYQKCIDKKTVEQYKPRYFNGIYTSPGAGLVPVRAAVCELGLPLWRHPKRRYSGG